MSSVELREKILKKLESVDDHILKEVLTLIEFETKEGVYKLSNDQKSAVIESRQQIKDGNTFTNDEVDKEIDGWLSE